MNPYINREALMAMNHVGTQIMLLSDNLYAALLSAGVMICATIVLGYFLFCFPRKRSNCYREIVENKVFTLYPDTLYINQDNELETGKWGVERALKSKIAFR